MKPSEEIQKANSFSYEYDYEKIVNSGGYMSRWVYRKSHSSLEYFAKGKSNTKILEVGAQADQHRVYVNSNFEHYVVSDLNLDLMMLQRRAKGENREDSIEKKNVSYQQIDAMNIPYPDNCFDRTLATCLIAHLPNPEDALYEWRRVTRPGGQIDFYVACEPGVILRLARSLTHKRVKRESTYPYNLLEYSQHRNHFPAIHEFVHFVFKEDEIRRRFFPFPFLSWNFNLWAIYSVKINDVKSQ